MRLGCGEMRMIRDSRNDLYIGRVGQSCEGLFYIKLYRLYFLRDGITA